MTRGSAIRRSRSTKSATGPRDNPEKPAHNSGAAPVLGWCYTAPVPTTRPRYTLTDTGELAAMLDAAARRWPEEPRRKELLVRLAAAGSEAVSRELAESDDANRRQRQRAALAEIGGLVDADAVLDDRAWR